MQAVTAAIVHTGVTAAVVHALRVMGQLRTANANDLRFEWDESHPLTHLGREGGREGERERERERERET